MKKLIGRTAEKSELEAIYASKQAEFTLVYGRRRIGKTFLIKQFFKKKPCIFFHVTGVKDGLLSEQLEEFAKAIGNTFYNGATIAIPTTWMNAFEELDKAINSIGKAKKVILFMDEFPWMATKKSRLLQTLEYYWNRYWEDNSKLKLIICGSSAAWIVKKILDQKGGLHNRVTKKIILKPFTLPETKIFLNSKNFNLDHNKIVQIYLAIGGIPFYLEQLKRNHSVLTNINNLCFKENGLLLNEFERLFQSLFESHNEYISLIKLISTKRYGMARSDIEKYTAKQSFSGGRLTERLRDLEMAGFVKAFLPLYHKQYGLYYKVIDEFSYFYLKWIEPEKSSLLSLDPNHHYWNQKAKSPDYHAWSGYAFELLCYKHISAIKHQLDLPDDAKIGAWRHAPRVYGKEQGAQIDLIFDLHDSIVLCEIKYSDKPFLISKDYSNKLTNKIDVFKKVTGTKKQLLLSLITANGLRTNKYSEELVDSIVTIDDLF